MKATEIKKELETLGAVKLAQINGRNCFLVEPNYFSSLELHLSKQLFQTTDSFHVPKDYFNSLENDVLVKTSGRKEVKKDFALPSEYLDELETAILSKTTEAETPVVRMNQFGNQLKIWSAVAAAFVIGFVLFNPTESKECVTFACLLEQSQLTEDDFLQVYDVDVAEDLLEATSMTEELDFEDEELIEFLIEEDIDLDVLTYTIES